VSASLGPFSFDFVMRSGVVVYTDSDGKTRIAEGNTMAPKITTKAKRGFGLGLSGLAGF
jgi:hypothetical protein